MLSTRLIAQSFRVSAKSLLVKRSTTGLINQLPKRVAFFSTSTIQLNKGALKSILTQELDFEENDAFDLDNSHAAYLKTNNFEITESADNVLAKFTKKTDSETIHIFFDAQRITQSAYELRQLENELTQNEELESAELENERDLINNELNQASYTDVNVIIENNSTGKAVGFDLILSILSNEFSVSGITHFEDVASALDESAEAVQKRDTKYSGPPFGNLAEELQDSISAYLYDLGINTELAEVILAYASVKENKEYISWLSRFNSFLKN